MVCSSILSKIFPMLSHSSTEEAARHQVADVATRLIQLKPASHKRLVFPTNTSISGQESDTSRVSFSKPSHAEASPQVKSNPVVEAEAGSASGAETQPASDSQLEQSMAGSTSKSPTSPVPSLDLSSPRTMASSGKDVSSVF